MSLLSLITGSHDLQQLIITNTSNDRLCLEFDLVNGNSIKKLHLYLQCDSAHHPFDDVDVPYKLNFTKCFNDIPPGNNWTLYICDRVLPNVSDTCSNPAVILTNINITGEVHMVSPSIVISTSMSADKTSSSQTSKCLHCNKHCLHLFNRCFEYNNSY